MGPFHRWETRPRGRLVLSTATGVGSITGMWIKVFRLQTEFSSPELMGPVFKPRGDEITKQRFENVFNTPFVAQDDSVLRRQNVYGKSPPQKLYFSDHHHLFVEKHSSVINNRSEGLEQTRVCCWGFLLLYTEDFCSCQPHSLCCVKLFICSCMALR